MAPTPLTPPSSGSEPSSPLAARAGVNKKRLPRRSGTSSKAASPKFTWKDHHRKTLLVCRQRKLLGKDISRVFNLLYREDCILAGYEDGISQKTLESQWQDHRKVDNKTWQKILACSDEELESSRRKMEECLANDLPHVESTPTARQWRTSTRNTRVQTFGVRNTPSSSPATAIEDAESITIAIEPLTPIPSNSNKTKRLTDQTPFHPSLSSESGLPQEQTRRKAVNTSRTRSIVSKNDKFPTYDKETRTRIVEGKQVSLAKATDEYLVVPRRIRPEEAHSPVPGLLFRAYDDDTQGVRGPAVGGELAGKFVHLTCPAPEPLPCGNSCLFTTIVNHINYAKTPSEVISTTSNLFFAMTRAAKLTANPRIKVIYSDLIPKEAIYYARPYHWRIKDKKWFFAGKWNNSTYHEYLIWAKIPQTAVLCDFSFAELERYLIGNPSMQQVLRINSLRSGDGNTNLTNQFKKENLVLSFPMVEGLAKFLRHFSIDIRTSPTIIARLVSETMRGFVVGLPETTALRWNMLAEAFTFALTADEPMTNVSEETLYGVKEAFKLGLCTSLGDINWHLDADKKRLMLMRGTQKGLDVRMVLVDEIPIKQCQMDSADVANDPQLIDLTGEDDDDDDDEEHSEEHSEDSGNEDGYRMVEDEAQTEEAQSAQPQRQQQRVHKSHHDEPQENHMTDDEEAETEIEEAAQPRPYLKNLSKFKYRLTGHELAEARTEIDSEPRLSQRMPPSATTDQRRRRRSSRRRSTPIRYNFSRADEVYDIVDQSDGSDDEYTGAADDEDDMEFEVVENL
ncbi:hypothetical protein KCU65_g8186, partial [Aureobasidium melanogenum]